MSKRLLAYGAIVLAVLFLLLGLIFLGKRDLEVMAHGGIGIVVAGTHYRQRG